MHSEIEGIEKLRKGSEILILASILIIIAFFALALSLFAASSYTTTTLSTIMGILMAYIIMEIIGDVGGIIGMFYIRKGFEILRNLSRDVGIGYTGATLAFVGIGLSILGAALTFVGGGAVTTVGNVIVFVGNVLIGIGFYRLGEIYNESTTKIGGILVIIIPFVGYILTYSGLGKIIERPLAPPSQPQIYQVGQGTIGGDGSAKITLYSNTQAVIMSARIEGTTLASANINPAVLQPGQNEITIKFDNVSSLTPGGNYLITLFIKIGENIIEIKAVAIYQP